MTRRERKKAKLWKRCPKRRKAKKKPTTEMYSLAEGEMLYCQCGHKLIAGDWAEIDFEGNVVSCGSCNQPDEEIDVDA